MPDDVVIRVKLDLDSGKYEALIDLVNRLQTDWVTGACMNDDAVESVRRLGKTVADNIMTALAL